MDHFGGRARLQKKLTPPTPMMVAGVTAHLRPAPQSRRWGGPGGIGDIGSTVRIRFVLPTANEVIGILDTYLGGAEYARLRARLVRHWQPEVADPVIPLHNVNAADPERRVLRGTAFDAHDGKVVRVPIPSPTEERRKELVKHIHKALENHRTAVRNIRRDIKEAIDKLEKDKKISQDEQKRALDELEKVSHSETKKIEDLSALKEKEVMEIK